MRRRGDRVRTTTGKYAGRTRARLNQTAYQKSVDYPTELSNGSLVLLDTGEAVIVRWDQVETFD